MKPLVAVCLLLLVITAPTTGFAQGAFTDVTPTMMRDLGGWSSNWKDYDNDGDFDLLIGRSLDDKLLRYDGNLEFTDVTPQLLAAPLHSIQSDWADYDNDDDLDLFVLKQDDWQSPLTNLLARNDGNNVFEDVIGKPGVDSLAAPTAGGFLWSDLDNDGDLDLYVTNALETVPNRMFRNDGNGLFTLVPAGAASGIGPALYPAAADFDNDGDRDIYLPHHGAANQLLRNDGGFNFEDVAFDLGVAVPGSGWTAGWGDYDNDSDLDLFAVCASYPGHKLFRNDGAAGFTDVTVDAGIIAEEQYGQGHWVDYDNDGYLDLLVGNYLTSNRMYRNNGAGHFTDVASPPYQDPPQVSGSSLADLDHDGDVDLFFSFADGTSTMLLRNDLLPGNHWLHVRLIGNPDLGPPFSNVSAIGARVHLEAGGMTQVREIASSSCSLPVEFGLGQATSIDRIEVHWPSGRVDMCVSPSFLNEQLSWVEGEPCPSVAIAAAAQPARGFMLHQNYPNPFNPSTTITYELLAPSIVTLRIHDVSGRLVRVLQPATVIGSGQQEVRWDGRDDRGHVVGSGVYYFRVESDDWQETRAMVLVK